MYLSDKKGGIIRQLNDHEDAEVLLESFAKQVEEIVTECETMMSNVQTTQEIVELILDSNRNTLLTLDLKVSIGTLGIGVGALLAGLFGMNLQSHWEEHPWAFYGVSLTAISTTLLVSLIVLRRLGKIRKIGVTNSLKPSKPPVRKWFSLSRPTPQNADTWLP